MTEVGTLKPHEFIGALLTLSPQEVKILRVTKTVTQFRSDAFSRKGPLHHEQEPLPTTRLILVRQRIVINSTHQEARVALLENETLVEIHIERAQQRNVAGNIYLGRVNRVLPGMQGRVR